MNGESYRLKETRKFNSGNNVFKDFIWKFTKLNVTLHTIGKWYTFQLLSDTLLDYHIQELNQLIN